MVTWLRTRALLFVTVFYLSSCAYIANDKGQPLREFSSNELSNKEIDEVTRKMKEISLLHLNQDEATEYIRAFAYATVHENNLTNIESCNVIPKDIIHVPGYKAFPFWGNNSYITSCTKAVKEKSFIPIKKTKPKTGVTESIKKKSVIINE